MYGRRRESAEGDVREKVPTVLLRNRLGCAVKSPSELGLDWTLPAEPNRCIRGATGALNPLW